jgi:hypothetical protein
MKASTAARNQRAVVLTKEDCDGTACEHAHWPREAELGMIRRLKIPNGIGTLRFSSIEKLLKLKNPNC